MFPKWSTFLNSFFFFSSIFWVHTAMTPAAAGSLLSPYPWTPLYRSEPSPTSVLNSVHSSFLLSMYFSCLHFSTPSGLYCCCRADRSTPPTVPLIPLNTPTLFPCGIKPPVWLTCSQTRWTEREKHMDSDNVCVCLRER